MKVKVTAMLEIPAGTYDKDVDIEQEIKDNFEGMVNDGDTTVSEITTEVVEKDPEEDEEGEEKTGSDE